LKITRSLSYRLVPLPPTHWSRGLKMDTSEHVGRCWLVSPSILKEISFQIREFRFILIIRLIIIITIPVNFWTSWCTFCGFIHFTGHLVNLSNFEYALSFKVFVFSWVIVGKAVGLTMYRFEFILGVYEYLVVAFIN